MTALSFDDLSALDRSDLATEKLDRWAKADQIILRNLTENGLSTEFGDLTPKGVKAAKVVKKKFGAFKKGIPVEERVRSEAQTIERHDIGHISWTFGEYCRKMYVTNGDFLFLGKPFKSMKASEGLAKTRQVIASMLLSQCSGRSSEFLELTPALYQVDKTDTVQMVWLVSKNPELAIAVQAMYFDFVREKFPKAVFWIKHRRWLAGEKVPVLARVTNKGLKNNVTALIMPLDMEIKDCPIFFSGGGASGDVQNR